MKTYFILLFVLFSIGCSHKLHDKTTYNAANLNSKVLEQSLIDISDPNKSSISFLVLDIHHHDALVGAKIHFINLMDQFDQGEEYGNSLDGVVNIKSIRGGIYKINVIYVGYYSLTIDSLKIEKGKHVSLKVGLHALPTKL